MSRFSRIPPITPTTGTTVGPLPTGNSCQAYPTGGGAPTERRASRDSRDALLSCSPLTDTAQFDPGAALGVTRP